MKSLNGLRELLARGDYRFSDPQIELEQYNTPVDIASFCVWNAHLNGDIANKVVLDLGSGTGILSHTCGLVGAAHVVGVEIDGSAIRKAVEENLWATSTDFVQAQVSPHTLSNMFRVKFDVAITNPPFGTKNQEHADTVFIREALSVSNVVYSFHLSKSFEFLQDWSQREFVGVTMNLVARVDYPMEKIYRKHRQQVKLVKVDILRWSM